MMYKICPKCGSSDIKARFNIVIEIPATAPIPRYKTVMLRIKSMRLVMTSSHKTYICDSVICGWASKCHYCKSEHYEGYCPYCTKNKGYR